MFASKACFLFAFGVATVLTSASGWAWEPGVNGIAAGAVDPSANKPARQVLDRLDTAWNATDGQRFAAEFAQDADVININGSHFSGRADIARQMQFLFDGRFKGSRHGERVIELTRELGPGLMLVVSSAKILMPPGAPAAELRSRQSFLLEKSGDRWLIRHWHNTPIRDVVEGAPFR